MSAGHPAPWAGGIAARSCGPKAGEAVLWIHGYTLDSSIWESLWRRLPAWRHIGIDLPGHGASRPFGTDEDLPALARSLAGAALADGVRHIVALSFGTMIALQMVIENPHAFGSLVLAAPAMVGGPEDPASADRYRQLARLYWEQGPGPHMRDLWMSSPPDIFLGSQDQPALWQSLAALVDRHSWTELTDWSMVRLTRRPQEPAALQTVDTDTLVLIGEREIPAFRQCASMITASLPRAQVSEVAGAGHLCLIEAPEQAARLLEAHLSKRGLPTHEEPGSISAS